MRKLHTSFLALPTVALSTLLTSALSTLAVLGCVPGSDDAADTYPSNETGDTGSSGTDETGEQDRSCPGSHTVDEGAFLTWSECRLYDTVVECCVEAGAPAGYVVDLDFRNSLGQFVPWGTNPAISLPDVWVSDGFTVGAIVSWDLCDDGGDVITLVLEAKDPDGEPDDGWLGAYRVIDFDESAC